MKTISISALIIILSSLFIPSNAEQNLCENEEKMSKMEDEFLSWLIDPKISNMVVRHSESRREFRFGAIIFNSNIKEVVYLEMFTEYMVLARATNFYAWENLNGTLENLDRMLSTYQASMPSAVDVTVLPNFVLAGGEAQSLTNTAETIQNMMTGHAVALSSAVDKFARENVCAIQRARNGNEIIQTVVAVSDTAASDSRARCVVTGVLVHYGFSNFDRMFDSDIIVHKLGNGRYVPPFDFNMLAILYRAYDSYSSKKQAQRILAGMGRCEVVCVLLSDEQACE